MWTPLCCWLKRDRVIPIQSISFFVHSDFGHYRLKWYCLSLTIFQTAVVCSLWCPLWGRSLCHGPVRLICAFALALSQTLKRNNLYGSSRARWSRRSGTPRNEQTSILFLDHIPCNFMVAIFGRVNMQAHFSYVLCFDTFLLSNN